MGKKVKNSRQTAEREKPSSQAPTGKKGKSRKVRPNSILLADLFLWISVVDECLYHPMGAFDRAAKTEGYGSLGNVANRLKVLETRFGKLFQENKSSSSRYRSGVPTRRGAALAEIFVPIELLYSWAASLEQSGSFTEVRKLKELILYLVPRRAPRPRDQDDLDTSRISSSGVWHTRLYKTGRLRNPKSMAEWPTFGPSPIKPPARPSPISGRSRS
jgi:hypothetical protein